MKKSCGLVMLAVLAVWFCEGAGCSSSGGGQGGDAGAGAGAPGSNTASGGLGGGSAAAGGTAATGSGGTATGAGGATGGSGGGAGGTVSGGGEGGLAGAGGRATGGAGASGEGGAGMAGQGGPANGTGGAGQGGGAGGRGGAGAAGTSGRGAAGAGGGASTPDVLILLDRSGSMGAMIDGTTCTSGNCGASSKWSLVKTALAETLPTYESTVKWGLKLFASSNSCGVATGAEIAPGFSTAASIAARLDAVLPGSSTPTTAAELAGSSYLSTVVDGAPKFILLITDGIPTCGTQACAPDAAGQVANQCDDANAIAAVQTVHDTLGIPTMVVGIGIDGGAGADTLEKMALAGGLPRSASPAYYPAQTAGELMAAVQALITTAVP